MKKNLATADQLANFYEEEKKREVARIQEMFDAFRNEMAKDKYFYEDLMSHSMRLDQKDKDQKAQIQYQKYKVQEL